MIEPILFLYASRDGHTAHIARHIKNILVAQRCPFLDFNLDRERPALSLIRDAPLLVILSPIRYGFHLPSVDRFIRTNIKTLRGKPLAMASINLTARKPNKNAPETNPYFRKWVRQHNLSPTFAAVFAGKLDYPRYPLWEKMIIRFIMFITGGPTDPQSRIDFTDWQAVDIFAKQIDVQARKEKAA